MAFNELPQAESYRRIGSMMAVIGRVSVRGCRITGALGLR